jgi:Skp family chaperone for outer membrane proteins
MKRERKRLAALQDELRLTTDGDLKRLLEHELAGDQDEFERRTGNFRKEMLDDEAAAYHESFERIRAEVARYAKQKGIRLVRRSQSVVADDGDVDTTDRQAVLARLNRDIIYSDPQQADITDAIIERLNRSDDDR